MTDASNSEEREARVLHAPAIKSIHLTNPEKALQFGEVGGHNSYALKDEVVDALRMHTPCESPTELPVPAHLIEVAGEPSVMLQAEVEHGNVEYKLHLLDPNSERFMGLVTQLMWRCREGAGHAVYNIGVTDDGFPIGLPAKQMKRSLHTLHKMAKAGGATITSIKIRPAMDDPTAQVAEVHVSRPLVDTLDSPQQSDITIAVTGAIGSGKSTWIAVATSHVPDDGKGSARFRVFRHRHEIEDGRTSSVGRHVLGFDSEGNEVVPGASLGVSLGFGFARAAELPGSGVSTGDILQRSKTLVSLLDLAGDTKYIRTTIAGLLGSNPDYVQVMVSASSSLCMPPVVHEVHEGPTKSDAVSPPTFSIHTPPPSPHVGSDTTSTNTNTTPSSIMSAQGQQQCKLEASVRAHLLLAASLQIPLYIVVTKCDTVAHDELTRLLDRLRALMSKFNTAGCPDVLKVVSDEASAVKIATDLSSHAVIASDATVALERAVPSSGGGIHFPVPVLLTSSVTMRGMSLLSKFIGALKPRVDWASCLSKPAEVRIDDVFVVDAATIAAGFVTHGIVSVHDTLMLGPDLSGRFEAVIIKNIHVKRVPSSHARAGQAATFNVVRVSDGVPFPPSLLRRGQVLLHPALSSPLNNSIGHHNRLTCASEFRVDVTFCNPANCTFRVGHSVVVHCATVRQAARVVSVAPLRAQPLFGPPDDATLPHSTAGSSTEATAASGVGVGFDFPPPVTIARELSSVSQTEDYHTSVRLTLRFSHHPEYVVPGATVIVRDGRAIAAGSIVQVIEESRSVSAPPPTRRHAALETVKQPADVAFKHTAAALDAAAPLHSHSSPSIVHNFKPVRKRLHTLHDLEKATSTPEHHVALSTRVTTVTKAEKHRKRKDTESDDDGILGTLSSVGFL